MVNGIENQIMINRTAEYAKQTAERVSQMENAKAFAAHIEKEKVARDAQAVNEMEHSENKLVRREKDGGSQMGDDTQHEKNHEKEVSQEEILTVLPSEILGKEIDINI